MTLNLYIPTTHIQFLQGWDVVLYILPVLDHREHRGSVQQVSLPVLLEKRKHL